MIKYGRVVYAFLPADFYPIAVPSGPRPVLLSYYYLKRQKSPISELEKWRSFNQPYPLIIDSGVYTFHGKFSKGVLTASGFSHGVFDEDDWKLFRKENLKKKEVIDSYVDEYAQFLSDAKGLYDTAIEMDVDNLFGSEYSDIYYAKLLEKVPEELLMRVWHRSGRSFNDWTTWLNDDSKKWLSIEGGISNNRDIDFYKDFVFSAKKKNKKVHILAMTIPSILSMLPFDTTDSSTFKNGGRYGTVKIPGLGEVAFSNSTNLSEVSSSSMRHYKLLKPADYQFCLDYFKENDFTLEQLLSDKDAHYNRIILTLRYYDDHIDVPYIEQPRNVSLF